MQRFSVILVLVALIGVLGIGVKNVCASGALNPLDRPALRVENPGQCLLLDVTQAGKRLVAVGERGLVALSDDMGESWRQAKDVPTSVTLTRVQFLTPISGWAVGHAGVVLHTRDGGETWNRKLDGIVAANLALKAAQETVETKGPEDESAAGELKNAELLVADGADKPFLDLYFKNDRTGFVIGAYGMIFHTMDAGQTWNPWMDRVDNPGGSHLYSILSIGDELYLAGEFGLFFRSIEGGQRFERVETPYEGSYFTMVADAQGGIVLGGLRGNAYRTADRGETFTQLQVPVPISFSASARLMDGSLIFANQAGFLLQSLDEGKSLSLMKHIRLPPVAAILVLGDETILTAGIKGVSRIPLKE